MKASGCLRRRRNYIRLHAMIDSHAVMKLKLQKQIGGICSYNGCCLSRLHVLTVAVSKSPLPGASIIPVWNCLSGWLAAFQKCVYYCRSLCLHVWVWSLRVRVTVVVSVCQCAWMCLCESLCALCVCALCVFVSFKSTREVLSLMGLKSCRLTNLLHWGRQTERKRESWRVGETERKGEKSEIRRRVKGVSVREREKVEVRKWSNV